MELKPGYKQTEIGLIPEEWQAKPLAEIADLQVGYAFKSAWFGKYSGPRLLRGENVGYGRADWSDTRTLELANTEQFREYKLRIGDVVIGMDRTFTKSGAKVTLIRDVDSPCLLVQRVGRFLPKAIDNKFLWFILSSTPVQTALQLEQKGMDIPHLSRQEILAPLVPYPPLSEQHAIATTLSDVDTLLAKLDQLLAKKRDIKQGTMQELLTGKRRLPGFMGEWEEKPLQKLLHIPVTDGPHETPTFLRDGIPFLSVNNLVNNKVDFTDLRFISRQDHEIYSRKCKPQKGDLLLGKAASVGKIGIVDFDIEFNIWSPIALIRMANLHVPKFFYFCFQGANIIRQIELLTNSSSQGNIGMGDIEQLVFPVPQKEEQEAIAATLSEMDAEIAALEARREKMQAVKQGMMQELLTGRIRLV